MLKSQISHLVGFFKRKKCINEITRTIRDRDTKLLWMRHLIEDILNQMSTWHFVFPILKCYFHAKTSVLERCSMRMDPLRHSIPLLGKTQTQKRIQTKECDSCINQDYSRHKEQTQDKCSDWRSDWCVHVWLSLQGKSLSENKRTEQNINIWKYIFCAIKCKLI